MTFLLWQSDGGTRIASPRVVLRAAEVPVLQQANELRDRLVGTLQEEEDRIARAAHDACERARAQGHEQGLQEGREKLAATLVSLAQSSAGEHDRLRGDVAALALQVVRKLLGQFADDALLVALADTAARDTLPAQQMSLVVHPELLDAVRERLSAAGDAQAWHCELRGDPSCARDACRIETEHGSVDASLEAQLARLADAWGVKA